MAENEARLAYRCPRCRTVLYEFRLARGAHPQTIPGSGPLADSAETSYRCGCGQLFTHEEPGPSGPVARWIPRSG